MQSLHWRVLLLAVRRSLDSRLWNTHWCSPLGFHLTAWIEDDLDFPKRSSARNPQWDYCWMKMDKNKVTSGQKVFCRMESTKESPYSPRERMSDLIENDSDGMKMQTPTDSDWLHCMTAFRLTICASNLEASEISRRDLHIQNANRSRALHCFDENLLTIISSVFRSNYFELNNYLIKQLHSILSASFQLSLRSALRWKIHWIPWIRNVLLDTFMQSPVQSLIVAHGDRLI